MKRFLMPALVASLTLTQVANANWWYGLPELAHSTVQTLFRIRSQRTVHDSMVIVRKFNEDMNDGLPFIYSTDDATGKGQVVMIRTARKAKLGKADELFNYIATKSSAESSTIDTLGINVSRYFKVKAADVGDTIPTEVAFARLHDRLEMALASIQSTGRGHSAGATTHLSETMTASLNEARTTVRVAGRADGGSLIHASIEMRVPFDELVPSDLGMINDALSRVVGTPYDDMLRRISLESF